ncbi:GrpB family protein [Algicola sagamiensis]|uniref:GrpB family protein n=1 Tax=Algicola sagamiensis TaxID=163869 RepID=UPI000376BEBF|nr:GrpB family protein [Algicola sagamiensis]
MLQRKIEVFPYQEHWPIQFQEESQQLKQSLADSIYAIHHIGSTAVPGLAAKPIIDILIETDDLTLLDQKSDLFILFGYEPKGELGIPGRRFFPKGGNLRTHHIHAFETGSLHVIRHLAFRDYLIAHPEIARSYGSLKYEIARTCNHDNDIYCLNKHDFVVKHEQKALGWVKSR